MFFELLTPYLTSIAYIDQLNMQEQLVIVANHFTYGNGVDKQVFSQAPRIQILPPLVLNSVVSQNPYASRSRHVVDDSLDDSPIQKLNLCVGGFAGKG